METVRHDQPRVDRRDPGEREPAARGVPGQQRAGGGEGADLRDEGIAAACCGGCGTDRPDEVTRRRNGQQLRPSRHRFAESVRPYLTARRKDSTNLSGQK